MKLLGGMFAALSGAALMAAGCSTRVSLGGDVRGEGGAPDVPPMPGPGGFTGAGGGDPGVCAGMACGSPCRVQEDCGDQEPCSAFLGFCDEHGACVAGPPPCSECTGQPCGAPCACNGPDCDPMSSDGAGFCDGVGFCSSFVYCEPCQPSFFSPTQLACGEPCDPCLGNVPFEPDNCARPDLYACNALGYCEYSPTVECASYDSCQEGLSFCGDPCTMCNPNSSSYEDCVYREMSGPPLACDASLTCVSVLPVPPDCI